MLETMTVTSNKNEQQKHRHKDRLLEEDLLQFFVFRSTDFVFPSDFVYIFFNVNVS